MVKVFFFYHEFLIFIGCHLWYIKTTNFKNAGFRGDYNTAIGRLLGKKKKLNEKR